MCVTFFFKGILLWNPPPYRDFAANKHLAINNNINNLILYCIDNTNISAKGWTPFFDSS